MSENLTSFGLTVNCPTMAEQNKRTPYPTDLSDTEWQKIEPHIPKPKTKRGAKRVHPLREILNAIFYVLRSGCSGACYRMTCHLGRRLPLLSPLAA